jgi:vacuolar-type H+-ATPase subunit E/Vma4
MEQLHQEAEQLRQQQRAELERISALSPEEARAIILKRVDALMQRKRRWIVPVNAARR